MKKSDEFKRAVPLAKFNLIYYTVTPSKRWRVSTPHVLDHTDDPATVELWVMSFYDASLRKGHFEIREASEDLTKFTHVQFYCKDCSPRFGALKRIEYSEHATGYSTLFDSEERVCYECCATRDKAYMKEHGEIALYLSDDGAMSSARVGNWAGSLSFKVINYRRSKHNIAGVRYDVWFRDDDGAIWWGVNYGHNSQITRCRRTKRRRVY